MVLILRYSELGLRVDDAAIQVTRFDEGHAIGIVVAGIHDSDSNAPVPSEDVAKRYYIPIFRQTINACVCEMGASDVF